jgi:deoxyribose-phosphate aldolase
VNISKIIDHTLLVPDASEDAMVTLCEEAVKYGFYSVCVYPTFIKKAGEVLFGSHVKVSSVIGFPSGATLPEVKIYESIVAVLNGADELDIVLNIGALKSGDWQSVARELEDIIAATPEAVHKIIIETCYLDDKEKKRVCEIVMNSGAEFIKTSSGFGPAGADVKDVKLLKSITGEQIGIKAAGGIRTLKDIMAFLDAGATRIGTSSGVEIMNELD